LNKILNLDAGGVDKGFACGKGLAERIVFETIQNLVGGVEQGDVLGFTIGDGAFENNRLGCEFCAFILLGARDFRGFLIAGFPFLECLVELDDPLVAISQFVVESGDGFFRACLVLVGFFDDSLVLFGQFDDLCLQFLGFRLSSGLGGLQVCSLGLCGAELQDGGLELLAEFLRWIDPPVRPEPRGRRKESRVAGI
jgi:hypothetical protein